MKKSDGHEYEFVPEGDTACSPAASPDAATFISIRTAE